MFSLSEAKQSKSSDLAMKNIQEQAWKATLSEAAMLEPILKILHVIICNKLWPDGAATGPDHKHIAAERIEPHGMQNAVTLNRQ